MYEGFFGLSTRPFADRPDPEFFVESEQQAAALRALQDGLGARQPILLVTGETGCGKTLLARALLQGLGEDVTVGVITNPHASVSDLTRWALLSFGQETLARTDAELSDALALFFVSEYSAGRKCLLVIDEAQNLTVPALASLQQYLDINSDDECLLQAMLVSEPRLLRTLRDPGLARWSDRLPLICRVGPLPLDEVPLYVRSRLAIAGAEHDIFTERAIAAVGIASAGVPRLINAICDMALVYAFARGSRTVDRDLIADVRAEGQAAGFGSLAMLAPIGQPEPEAIAEQMPADTTSPPPAPPAVEPPDIARFTESAIAAPTAPAIPWAQPPQSVEAALLEPTMPPEVAPSETPTEPIPPLVAASTTAQPAPAAPTVALPEAIAPPTTNLGAPDQPPAQIVYTQGGAGWPSISGRSNLGRVGRPGALRTGSISGGVSLRRRFLPRD